MHEFNETSCQTAENDDVLVAGSRAVGRLRCLVLADFETRFTTTVAKHLISLRDMSIHEVQLVHAPTLDWLTIDFNRFDAIVFHYSIAIAPGYFLKPALRSRLAASSALKILFIQDEYRWIDDTAKAMGELGVSVLFSVANEEAVHQIYNHAWLKDVRKEVTLTGFVDETLLALNVPPYEKRVTDVVYRARKVPYWLGKFGMEKSWVGERFLRDAHRYDLLCDISSDEASRIYGSRWIDFLSSAKAVLGTESGASVCDFSGSLQSRADALVAESPDISFDAVFDSLLRDHDGGIVIHVISPRIFEAAALRTLMVNYPGDYSGRLVAWRHYVPLEKDHSNMDEVVQVIKDAERAKRIIDAAYVEVACNPDNSFRAMVAHFDRVVSEEFGISPDHAFGSKRQPRRLTFLEIVSWADIYARRLKRQLLRCLDWRCFPFAPR